MILRAAAALLVLFLVVLVVMNLLVVSNLRDQVQALQEEVERLRPQAPRGAPAVSDVPFELVTPAFTTGPGGAVAPVTVPLGLGPAPRKAVVTLTEVAFPDGGRTPVHTTPVLLLSGSTSDMPLGRDAGCVAVGGATPFWSVSLEGGALRIAPRNCVYPRPTRATVRGLVSP